VLIPGMSAIDEEATEVGCTAGAAAADGSTTVSLPFIPASLWPGIEQMKSKTPGLSNVNSPDAV
jgi:hypothetical protein